MDTSLFDVVCAYCGKEFPPGDKGMEMVTGHIPECDKHPISQLKKEVSRLERELIAAKAVINALTNSIKTIKA